MDAFIKDTGADSEMNCVVLNQRHSVSFLRSDGTKKKNLWNSEFVLRHSLLWREQRFDFVFFFFALTVYTRQIKRRLPPNRVKLSVSHMQTGVQKPGQVRSEETSDVCLDLQPWCIYIYISFFFPLPKRKRTQLQ